MLKKIRSGFCKKKQPALELSKRRQMKLFLSTGASPLMRERRINKNYDARFAVRLQTEFSVNHQRRRRQQRTKNGKRTLSVCGFFIFSPVFDSLSTGSSVPAPVNL
jgi:hypothetical protein